MFNQARGVTAIQYTNASYRDRFLNIYRARQMMGTPRTLRREARALELAADMILALRPACPEQAEHREQMLSWASSKASMARTLRWINL